MHLHQMVNARQMISSNERRSADIAGKQQRFAILVGNARTASEKASTVFGSGVSARRTVQALDALLCTPVNLAREQLLRKGL